MLRRIGGRLEAGKYLFLPGRRDPEYQSDIDFYFLRHRRVHMNQLISGFPAAIRSRGLDNLPENFRDTLTRWGSREHVRWLNHLARTESRRLEDLTRGERRRQRDLAESERRWRENRIDTEPSMHRSRSNGKESGESNAPKEPTDLFGMAIGLTLAFIVIFLLLAAAYIWPEFFSE
jgi:hypothetical protein